VLLSVSLSFICVLVHMFFISCFITPSGVFMGNKYFHAFIHIPLRCILLSLFLFKEGIGSLNFHSSDQFPIFCDN